MADASTTGIIRRNIPAQQHVIYLSQDTGYSNGIDIAILR
jgi:hypothetical protein